jgi:DNA-binding CsgD family transcriptional regulator
MKLTLLYQFNHPAPVEAIHGVIYATLETLPAWPPEYHIQLSTRPHESLAGGLKIELVGKDAADLLQCVLVVSLGPVLGSSYIGMEISPDPRPVLGGSYTGMEISPLDLRGPTCPRQELPLRRLFRALAERLKAEIEQLEFTQGEQAPKGVPQLLAKQDRHGLAPRHNRVAHLIATGKNDAEIAEQMDLKVSAAEKYRKDIAAHFNVSSTPKILQTKLLDLGYGGDENIP